MATPGNRITVLKPVTWWAPKGTILPDINLPYNSAWPTGWEKIDDTVQGLQITLRNPKEAITSDERGRIGQIPGGDDGIAIGFQDRTPTMAFTQKVSSLVKASIAESTAVGEEAPAYDSFWLDKNVDNQFMMGFEGTALAGSLFATNTLIRGIGFCVENTENAEHAFRATGNDALFQPTVALECLPIEIEDAQITGTGITRGALDPNGRFNYFVVSAAA